MHRASPEWRHGPVPFPAGTAPCRSACRVAGLLGACRRGVVALEYGLLAGMIPLASSVGFGKPGGALTSTCKDLAAKLDY